MTRKQTEHWFRIAVAILLVVLAVLSATGHLDRAIGACGLTRLTEANDQYLGASFDKSFKAFLTLSAIKSGVAILEGSTVGVGFNLQVGDIVQSIYDYVDVAWRAALAGGIILLLTRIVLQALQAVEQWFLLGSLVLCFVAFMLRWWLPKQSKPLRIVKEFILFSASLTIALYFILPASIAGAAYLSQRITAPLVEEARTGFETVKNDLTPQALSRRFFPQGEEDESLWSRLDFKSKLQNSRQALNNMGAWLAEISEDFAIWTIQMIAGYLFDCIVFPFAFLVVVYIITRALLVYILGISRKQSMREDIEAVLRKYFSRRPAADEADCPDHE